MSYKALSWALQQKGLKPITKIVLIALADRHNPDHGCFPSIGKIAEDCEICEKSVYVHLLVLEKAGLIARTGRIRANGQQTSNEYKLFRGVQNIHGDYVRGTSPGVQNIHTNNLVSINHVSEPKKQTDLFDAYFDQWWDIYPRKTGKTAAKKAAIKAMKIIEPHKLSEKLSEYVATKTDTPQKYIPHLSTWLNGERWNDELEAPDITGIDHDFRNMVNDLARVQR